jgi:hypothetical protein
MLDILQEKPWIAVTAAVVLVLIAVFVGARSLGLMPVARITKEESLRRERETHDKLQVELQQKYGIQPKPYGLPGAAGIPGGGMAPAPQATPAAAGR